MTAASQGLVQLAESLIEPRGAARGVCRGRRARTLDALTLDGQPVGARSRALDTALGPLLDAQAAGDWITVADILEYEVAPSIPPLRDVFDALRHTARPR